MTNPERIRQARELCGLTQVELAHSVGVTQSRIAQFEGGFTDVPSSLVQAIALKTRFPISFFHELTPVDIGYGSLLYRAHSAISRRGRLKAYRHAQLVFEISQALARHFDLPPVNIPKMDNPSTAARQIREVFALDALSPVNYLIRTIEKNGVIVLGLPPLEYMDAFSVSPAPPLTRPIIAISDGRPGDRLRFNIAHELGHLVMHQDVRKGSREVEIQAYRFAAEFLMPEKMMRREIQTPVTLRTISRLKPRWGVSVQALIRRARDLEIITERQYRYLFQQLSRNGWRKREPAYLDIPSEKPRLLRKIAEEVYGFPVDYKLFAADFKLSPETAREIIERYASKLDFAPKEQSGSEHNVITFPVAKSGSKLRT